jgi:hypothetical protein
MAYEKGDGLVIMTNSDRGGVLAGEVQRTIAYEYNWPDFQPVQRTVVKIDPKIFDAYAGAYVIGRQYLTVSRHGDHFYAHITGQEPVEIFPQSDHEFFLKDVDALLTFDTGPDGKAKQMTLRQNENIQGVSAPLGERETRLIMEQQAAAPRRFKEQTQDPRTEAVLRPLLEGIQRGEPKYDQMMPSLTNFLREDLARIESDMNRLGTIKELAFKGVTPGGADIYQVRFEHGDMQCRIMLARDGTIVILGF